MFGAVLCEGSLDRAIAIGHVSAHHQADMAR